MSRVTVRCDYCRDGLSFMKGEVDTFSLGYGFHRECYVNHAKEHHDKAKERLGYK